MILGSADSWLSKFQGFENVIMPRIVVLVRQAFKKLSDPNAHEDHITINLVELLAMDEVARTHFYYVEFQFEPTRENAHGAKFSLGKIDLAAHITPDRKTYLAFECKRLNIPNGSGTSSLATKYVTEGVVRFVTEQYSENLPLASMLGYVLDGKTDNAKLKVKKALNDNSGKIALQDGPTDISSSTSASRFSTKHIRSLSSTEIEVRHSLVPCV